MKLGKALLFTAIITFSWCEKFVQDLWDNLQGFKALTTQQKNAIISTFGNEDYILNWKLFHDYGCNFLFKKWKIVEEKKYNIRNDYHIVSINDPLYWEFSVIIKIEIKRDKKDTGNSIIELLKKLKWEEWPYINWVKVKLLDWYDWEEEYTICRDALILHLTKPSSKKQLS